MFRIDEPAQSFNPLYQPRPPLQRVNRKRRCPECGRADWCLIAADGSGALCMRRPGGKPTRNGGWWFAYRFDDAPRPLPRPSPQKATPPASIEHRDGVYAALLAALTLDPAHRAALIARGLSDAEIDARRYRSTPTPEQARAVARDLARHDLIGIPGFYKLGGEWRMADIGGGFYVPVRDERLRIVGLQVRRDEGEPRYIWFSSSNKPLGTGSGSPVHFALPHALPYTDEILITEGALKADITAHFLRAPVVAAAGVTNFGANFAAELRAKFPHLKTANIAFDSDWRTKPQVKAALEKLMGELVAAGFRARVRTWPPGHKGIDDYLLASSQAKGVAA